MSGSCTKPDERWLTLMNETSAWFDSPAGQQLLDQERRVIGQELSRCFGSYLVHYGPFANAAIEPQKIKRSVRWGHRSPVSRSCVRSSHGRSANTLPTSWWFSTASTSVSRPTPCCAKQPVASGRAGIC